MAKKKTTILQYDEAKKWLKDRINLDNSDKIGLKGYFKVSKRNYTAFRINSTGKLKVYKEIQHEGDCRHKLKLPSVL